MKKYLTIIAIIICGFANAQTGYLVQPAKWKFIKPQWLDSGMWIKNIPKYGGQNRILVYDSITNKVGYKYISSGSTYTAGRGLTLNSNVFRLDTTQGYTWTNAKSIFNGNVGIGTTTPTYPMTVKSSGGSETSTYFASMGTTTADAPSYSLLKSNGTLGAALVYWGSTNGFFPNTAQFYTNTGVNFQVAPAGAISTTFKTGGFVGIGTTSPVSKLHVGSAPTASANYGLVSLGSGAFDGSTSGFFTGSSNGTLLAGNLASGSTSDFINLQVGGSSKVKADNSGYFTVAKYFVSALNTAPSSANDTGTLGEIRITANYIYVCINTNVWVRTQLSTW